MSTHDTDTIHDKICCCQCHRYCVLFYVFGVHVIVPRAYPTGLLHTDSVSQTLAFAGDALDGIEGENKRS